MNNQSRREIVASLAARAGQPYDVSLQEELKHILMYKAATYLQQSMEKHPEQREIYSFDVQLKLVKADASECKDMPSGCEVLKTECEIPMPLRTSAELFTYVGDINGKNGYRHWSAENIRWDSGNRYTKKRVYYDYINNKIYVYGPMSLEFVRIRSVWEDPYQLAKCACNKEACLNEDSPFPFPRDLTTYIVKDILATELGRLVPLQDAEQVTTDEPEHVRGQNG